MPSSQNKLKKGYASFLTPISILLDLLVLNLTMYIISRELYFDMTYIVYFNLSWLIIGFKSKIYKIFRYTKMTQVISRLFIQFSVYFLSYFAYFSIFKEDVQTGNQFITLVIIFSTILVLKLVYVFALRKYRLGGGNFRNVVILGGNQSVDSLKILFKERSYLGYRYKGYFSDKHKDKEDHLGKLKDSFDYILENNIDEIYCAISAFSRKELKKIIKFGEVNNKTVKLIPSTTGMFTNGVEVEYYDYVPVLSLKKLPFDDPLIKYSKRLFDIIFSLIVIVFILPWVSLVLYFLIKLESKGPLIFKQVRDGLNGDQFVCYKFRSMGVNKDSDQKQATKEDDRITRVGRFIRKTSQPR